MGSSPWDCKESDGTEQLTFSLLQLKENVEDLSGLLSGARSGSGSYLYHRGSSDSVWSRAGHAEAGCDDARYSLLTATSGRGTY